MNAFFHVACPAILALLLVAGVSAQGQDIPQQQHHKDMVTEQYNPNADADIALVREFLTAHFKNDIVTVRRSVAPNYVSYGPAMSDSADLEQTLRDMQSNAQTQSDVHYEMLFHTFQVKSGPEQGTWVAAWGLHTFTESGRPVRFPFHYIARVANGQILSDILYFDRMDIARQLGYSMIPPVTAKK